eukprot:123801-Amphidinium_carterae.1
MQMQGIPDQQRAMQEALGADPCHQRAAASTPPHPKNLRQKPRREIVADLILGYLLNLGQRSG